MSKYLMVFFVRSLLVVARRGIHTGSQSLIKMSRIPTLISGADALEMFSNNSAKFIDCSWHLSKERSARNEYKSRRIPGAQFFDIDDVSDHSTGLPHMLPSADLFAGKVSKLGISSHDHVIVYASTGSFSSPRAWWMFRVFGHSKISIIDGGLEEWVRCGGSIEENEPTTEQVEGVFEAAYNPTLVKGWADVLQVVEDGSYQILDARSHARFVCEAPEPRPGLPGGHIPGSLNLPFTSIVQPDDVTKFRSLPEIRAAFDDAGIVLGSKVITTCGSGVSAAVLTLGLYLLDVELEHVPVYDGSWSEWGSREDLPKVQLNQPKDL